LATYLNGSFIKPFELYQNRQGKGTLERFVDMSLDDRETGIAE